MAKSAVCIVFQLLVALFAFSTCFCNTMGPECSSLSEVQIHYKNYYDMYFGENPFVASLNHDGLFVKMLKEAKKLCCSTAQLTFNFIPQTPSTDKEIEELVFESVKAERTNPKPGVVKLFYPEFAFKKKLQVYDTQTPFVRLARSPGPAMIMPKPEAKKPVFVGEIFLKSWAITIFLIALAWIVGILVWISDHHYNTKDFPSPFYVGMFEGFWWSVVTMTTVGYGDKAPKGPIARALAVVWIMISTVMLSLFTANASSILAISQFEEDHTNTLGKTIGCFNSKHFYDVELNLGSRVLGFSNILSLIVATQTGLINRMLFPNYLDFLYLRTRPEYVAMNDAYDLTNTLDHPFQIGMTYAVDVKNMSSMQDSFLRCLRSELPSLEKKIRRETFGLAEIKSQKSLKGEIKVPLDSDSLLTLTYWFFVIVACLVVLGLSWDFWMYWKRTRPHGQHDHGPEEGDVEMDHVSCTLEGGSGLVGDDVHSNTSGSPQGNKKYKMSISEGCTPPSPPPAPPPPC